MTEHLRRLAPSRIDLLAVTGPNYGWDVRFGTDEIPADFITLRASGASGEQAGTKKGRLCGTPYCSVIGSIRLGSLFRTLPLRALTGQQIISMEG